ncbi:GGDEF domain-containing protein [Salinisphaera hydrothermalis]|uniref:GGDEF domain-containing protein n=1 Tax=Salinisphaera hydrothermalis TaxID=563188 RepID=UPI00333E3E1B
MPLRHLSQEDETRRLVVLRVLLILTIVFGFVFVPVNVIQQVWTLALAEVAMMAYAFVILGLLASGLPPRRATWAFLLPFLAVLLLALATAANISVFVWVLLIPLLSHRLLGRRDGSIVGLSFLGLAAALMLVRFGFVPSVAQAAEAMDVLLCAAALFVISLAHETEIVRVNRKLRARADLDGLTHLANRRRFRELFEQARYAAQQGAPSAARQVSLILMDLDYFKRVNDRYGHDIGDIVLEAVSRRLLAQCRQSDVLGRVGGEELAILLFDLDHADAMRQADRLRCAISATPVLARDHVISLTLSLGVATFRLTECSFEHIFAETDARLYQAKRDGRNRTHGEPVTSAARAARIEPAAREAQRSRGYEMP